jgi:DNA-binding CsgD family transcriptional regulator
MGRYGNGASVEDIAHAAGCSEGSVENYTNHCFKAILSLQSQFVRKLTLAEKEVEKEWMDNHLGFQGS